MNSVALPAAARGSYIDLAMASHALVPDDEVAEAETFVPPLRALGIWSLHLLSLWFPLTALAFLLTGPHDWNVALGFMIPILVAALLDSRKLTATRQPHPKLPAWPFDALLYGLSAFQLVNIALLVHLFSVQGFWTMDALIAFLVVGANSGYSGIVVAHELVHRPKRWQQGLGRILLCTVLYEHFYTEHVRGHHARVGTPEDPATARYGESFAHFYFRTLPAQFRSAWRLEAKRLGDEQMKPWDRRLLRSRVVHGLVAEWGLAFTILGMAGPAAFGVFLLQALFATRALEVVNYFEHWGLMRSGDRVRTVDSWDTDSWFTYYGLVGLTRHADHHMHAARPYHQLRVCEESPRLPSGYIALFPLILVRNKKFQRLMTEELRRRRLGPFAEAASG